MLDLWLEAAKQYGPAAALILAALGGILAWGLKQNNARLEDYRRTFPETAAAVRANADAVALIARNQESRLSIERDMAASINENATAVDHLKTVLQLQLEGHKETISDLKDEIRRLTDLVQGRKGS